MNRILARHKKALFDYHILKTYEVGLVLQGPEVKSIRAGRCHLSDSYGIVRQGEVFIENLQVSRWSFTHDPHYDEKRSKKVLLKRHEIRSLQKDTDQKGLTLVVLNLFLSERGYIKATLGLARGKKQIDKREAIKDRDIAREWKQIEKEKLKRF